MSHGGGAGHRLVGLMAVLVVCTRPSYVGPQGGPPLLTDDPDTPGPGHWEINLATLLERSRLEYRLDRPRIDLNYGAGRRIQLKFEVPWVRVREGEAKTPIGAGDAVAGVK